MTEIEKSIQQTEKDLAELYKTIELKQKQLVKLYRYRTKYIKGNRNLPLKKRKKKKEKLRECKICGGKYYAKGFCRNCYERNRKTGSPFPKIKQSKILTSECKIKEDKRTKRLQSYGYNSIEELLFKLELSERNRKIIEMYFRGKNTLKEIGEEYGISRERVRQIIDGLLNKSKVKEPDEIKSDGTKKIRQSFKERLPPYMDEIGKIRIDELPLTIRPMNALARHNILTIQDVYDDADNITNIRNLGKKSLDSIVSVINETYNEKSKNDI